MVTALGHLDLAVDWLMLKMTAVNVKTENAGIEVTISLMHYESTRLQAGASRFSAKAYLG